MLSVNPNPPQGFSFLDPMMNMGGGGGGLPGLNTPLQQVNTDMSNTMSFGEDPCKKIRKPYTITKSRESWSEQEHDKFLEALQLFDRDWKKIEAFVGSKTVIQIRSHAQKYFLKVQKSGTSEHVPPPRPKRKASHPYPQKAAKTAAFCGAFQSSPALLEPGYLYGPDPSSVLADPVVSVPMSSWNYSSVQPDIISKVVEDEPGRSVPGVANNCCYSSSNESTPRTWTIAEPTDRESQGKPTRVMPDFAQVYSFIGSVFDPNASGHLQRLKQMNPINLETILLLMRNLSINLTSPEFEDHRRLLTSYNASTERDRFGCGYDNMHTDNSGSVITSV